MRTGFISAALMMFCLIAPSVTAQDIGKRLVLHMTDMKRTTDGRVVVTLKSGATMTLAATDIDVDTTLALVNIDVAKALNDVNQAASAYQTAPKAAPASRKVEMLPTHDVAMPGIRTKCAKEWPTDFTMQEYCQTQQREGLSQLWKNNEFVLRGDANGSTIRIKCQSDWPDDFTMRAYCEDQQMKALKAIK